MTDITRWLHEAKKDAAASECGMYLIHNGVVRGTAKAQVRGSESLNSGEQPAENKAVKAMDFSYDKEKVDKAIEEAKAMPGIKLVKVWLNKGVLFVGDDIMYVMVGGDIRPHVIDCLEKLVGTIKNECVSETEIF